VDRWGVYGDDEGYYLYIDLMGVIQFEVGFINRGTEQVALFQVKGVMMGKGMVTHS
jgi:hypothetical protein